MAAEMPARGPKAALAALLWKAVDATRQDDTVDLRAASRRLALEDPQWRTAHGVGSSLGEAMRRCGIRGSFADQNTFRLVRQSNHLPLEQASRVRDALRTALKGGESCAGATLGQVLHKTWPAWKEDTRRRNFRQLAFACPGVVAVPGGHELLLSFGMVPKRASEPAAAASPSAAAKAKAKPAAAADAAAAAAAPKAKAAAPSAMAYLTPQQSMRMRSAVGMAMGGRNVCSGGELGPVLSKTWPAWKADTGYRTMQDMIRDCPGLRSVWVAGKELQIYFENVADARPSYALALAPSPPVAAQPQPPQPPPPQPLHEPQPPQPQPPQPQQPQQGGWLSFTPGGRVVVQPFGNAGAPPGAAVDVARLAQLEEAKADADLDSLLDLFPPYFTEFLAEATGPGDLLLDLALDLGRAPSARVARAGGATELVQMQEFYEAEREDIDGVCEGAELRGGACGGVDGTLHRVALFGGEPAAGVTARVGRQSRSAGLLAADLAAAAGRSILVLGAPGTGKTTALRELARLGAAAEPATVVVDVENELGGGGSAAAPHAAIGAARRVPVAAPEGLARAMGDAARKHLARCVVADGLGTRAEAEQARRLARGGVRVLAAAQARSLDDVVHSDELGCLAAAGRPAFGAFVEVEGPARWVVHADAARAVEAVRRGGPLEVEVRELIADAEGKLRARVTFETRQYQGE